MQTNKTEQLQIRVSAQQKTRIKQAARAANVSMSDWVLKKLLPGHQLHFQRLINDLCRSEQASYSLASLNDFLTKLTRDDFLEAVHEKPRLPDDQYLQNYLAAMIEVTAHRNQENAPDWVADIRPLKKPIFGTDLKNLRLYLLTRSPPPFRSRNIFIDSTIGDRL